MSKVDILINKCMNVKNENYDFWIRAYKEMQEIINGNYPQEEKDKLLELGCGEMISMMYDGILNECKENKI